MMIARSLLLATALLAASLGRGIGADCATTSSPPRCCAPTSPSSGDVVRIGDVIDNAGTCGADRDLSRARSRHHRLAAGGAGARRAARASGDRRRHQGYQARFGDAAGAHARGQGHRARRSRARWSATTALATPPISRSPSTATSQDLQLDASNTGALQPVSARYEPRNGRFDVTFEIASDSARRRPGCASPAPRSRPSKPRC